MSCFDNASIGDVSAYRRPPQVVMRLDRLGSIHHCRLSFMRSLLRRLKKEQWKFKRNLWDMDEQGFGRAVYTVYGTERNYSLVAFSQYLADENRSDRVIATAWDASFALFDGIPTAEDVARLEQNVPKQEAGRVSDSELSLSRANKSVRLWQQVVDSLASGQQPDREQLESVGYLIRTTAVYGSGKFGSADRLTIADRPEFRGAFQQEMLSVWLTRAFSVDLVEHVARVRGGEKAATIDPAMRRRIGVGNSTGLGLAPFLINHPSLLNNWILAREEALARVRALESAEQEAINRFRQKFEQAEFNLSEWHSEHPIQIEKLKNLKNDFNKMHGYLADNSLSDNHPWDRFYRWAESGLTLEGQEQLVSLLLEPYPERVDELSDCMEADEHKHFFIDGAMTLKQLRELIETHCQWALDIDFSEQDSRARFWYTSAEKLEPRLGERFKEPGAEYELPLTTGLYFRELYDAVLADEEIENIADFLLAHPEHRYAIRRVQILQSCPYAEIQDNLISSDMLPIDILRCKLAFFGATRFDPRSNLWVRISMYRDAPYPHELLEEMA